MYYTLNKAAANNNSLRKKDANNKALNGKKMQNTIFNAYLSLNNKINFTLCFILYKLLQYTGVITHFLLLAGVGI